MLFPVLATRRLFQFRPQYRFANHRTLILKPHLWVVSKDVGNKFGFHSHGRRQQERKKYSGSSDQSITDTIDQHVDSQNDNSSKPQAQPIEDDGTKELVPWTIISDSRESSPSKPQAQAQMIEDANPQTIIRHEDKAADGEVKEIVTNDRTEKSTNHRDLFVELLETDFENEDKIDDESWADDMASYAAFLDKQSFITGEDSKPDFTPMSHHQSSDQENFTPLNHHQSSDVENVRNMPLEENKEPHTFVARPLNEVLRMRRLAFDKYARKIWALKSVERQRLEVDCHFNSKLSRQLQGLVTFASGGSYKITPGHNKIPLLIRLPVIHWRTYQSILHLLSAWRPGIKLGVAFPEKRALTKFGKPDLYSISLKLHNSVELISYRQAILDAVGLSIPNFEYKLETYLPQSILCWDVQRSDANAILESMQKRWPNGIDLGVGTRCTLKHTFKNLDGGIISTASPEYLMKGVKPNLASELLTNRKESEAVWEATLAEMENPTRPLAVGGYDFLAGRSKRLMQVGALDDDGFSKPDASGEGALSSG